MDPQAPCPWLSRGTTRDKPGRSAAYAGVAEDAEALDVRQLRRDGLLLPGRAFGVAWPGRRTRYFRVTGSLDTLLAIDGLPMALPLAWTACTFGGRRPWFRCPAPGCGRRVAVLYDGNGFFCRFCRRLTFQTRRLDPLDRALRRTRNLRVRLGGAPTVTGPLPPRPKGTHEWTYTRLAVAIISAELRASRAMPAIFEPPNETGSAGNKAARAFSLMLCSAESLSMWLFPPEKPRSQLLVPVYLQGNCLSSAPPTTQPA